MKEFKSVNKMLEEQGLYSKSNLGYVLPEDRTPVFNIKSKSTKNEKECNEMKLILKKCGYVSVSIPDEELSLLWFELFKNGELKDFADYDIDTKTAEVKKLPDIIAKYEYFQSGAWMLKKNRAITGLSQQEVCKKLEIPLTTWKQWESGARECPGYTIKLIVEKLKEFVKIE